MCTCPFHQSYHHLYIIIIIIITSRLHYHHTSQSVKANHSREREEAIRLKVPEVVIVLNTIANDDDDDRGSRTDDVADVHGTIQYIVKRLGYSGDGRNASQCNGRPQVEL